MLAAELGLYTCSACGDKEIDPSDRQRYEVKGWEVCSDCMELCEECDLPLDDEWIESLGIEVSLRDWVDPKSISKFHAECASIRLLRDWAEPTVFVHSINFATKEEITSIVERAFPKLARYWEAGRRLRLISWTQGFQLEFAEARKALEEK
jgi:hypothetical protein